MLGNLILSLFIFPVGGLIQGLAFILNFNLLMDSGLLQSGLNFLTTEMMALNSIFPYISQVLIYHGITGFYEALGMYHVISFGLRKLPFLDIS